jgi:peroxin-5
MKTLQDSYGFLLSGDAFGDTLGPDEISKWEAEFNQLMQAQREEDFDYGASMQQAWEDGLRGASEQVEQLKLDTNGMPIVASYEFGKHCSLSDTRYLLIIGTDQQNKYLDPSSSTEHPLHEAKALLARNGSLSEAALLLEAAIQKGDLGEGGYEAWILLGETRSMDEREEAGMKALAEGVRIAEKAGAKGPGMLVREFRKDRCSPAYC